MFVLENWLNLYYGCFMEFDFKTGNTSRTHCGNISPTYYQFVNEIVLSGLVIVSI